MFHAVFTVLFLICGVWITIRLRRILQLKSHAIEIPTTMADRKKNKGKQIKKNKSLGNMASKKNPASNSSEKVLLSANHSGRSSKQNSQIFTHELESALKKEQQIKDKVVASPTNDDLLLLASLSFKTIKQPVNQKPKSNINRKIMAISNGVDSVFDSINSSFSNMNSPADSISQNKPIMQAISGMQNLSLNASPREYPLISPEIHDVPTNTPHTVPPPQIDMEKVRSLEEKVETLKKERDELELKLEKAQPILIQTSKLQKENTALRESHYAVHDEYAKMRSTANQTQSNIAEMKKELEKLRAIERDTVDAEFFETFKNDASIKISTLELNLIEKNDTITKLESQANEIQTKLVASEKKTEKLVKTLKIASSTSEAKIKSLSIQLDQAVADGKKASLKIKSIGDELSEKCKALVKSNSHIEKMKDEYELHLQTLTKNFEQSVEENTSLQQKLKDSEEKSALEIKKIQNAFEQCTLAFSSSKSINERLMLENIDFEKRIVSKNSELMALQTERDDQLATLNETLHENQSTMKALEDEIAIVVSRNAELEHTALECERRYVKKINELEAASQKKERAVSTSKSIIQQLKNETAKYEQEINTNLETISQLESSINEYETKISTLEKSISVADSSLLNSHLLVDKLQTEINLMSIEIVHLKSELSEFEAVKAKTQECQVKIAQLEENVSKRERAISTSKAIIQQLKSESVGLEKTVIAENNEILALKEVNMLNEVKIQDLLDKLSVRDGEIFSAHEQISKLESQHVEYEIKMKDNQSKLVKLQEDLTKRIESVSALQTKIKAENTANSELKILNEENKLKIGSLEQNIEDLQTNIYEYKAKLATNNATISTDKEIIKQLNLVLESSRANIKSLQAESAAISKKLVASESFVEKSRSENEGLMTQILILEKETIDKTKILNQYHETEVHELQNTVHTRERAVSTSKSVIQQLKTENVRLEKQLSEAHIKIFEVEGTAFERISELESNLIAKAADVQNAESSIQLFKGEIQEAREKISTLVSNIEDLQVVLTSTSEKLRSSEFMNKTLKTEKETMEVIIASLNKDIIDKTRTLNQNHESEVNELQNAVQTRERAVSTSKTLIQQLKSENTRLEKQLSEAYIKISVVERLAFEQISEFESSLAAKKVEIENAESKIRSFEDEIMNSQDKIASLSSNIEELQTESSFTLDKLRTTELLVEKLEYENNNLEIQIESLNKDVIDKTRALNQYHETEINELQKTVHTRERAVSTSKSLIQQLKSENLKLEKQLSDAHVKISQVESTAFEKISELESNLLEKAVKVENAEFNIQSFEGEILNANEKIASLISNIEDLQAESKTTLDKLHTTELLVEKLESDNKNLEVQIECLNNDIIEKTRALHQNHETEVNELQKTVHTRERAVSTSKSLIQQLKSENIKLDKQLSDAHIKISQVEGTAFEQISELESNLLAKAADLESAERKIQCLRTEISKAHNENTLLANKIENLQNVVEDKESIINISQALTDSLNLQCNSLEEKFGKLEAANVEFEKLKNEHGKTKDELKQANNEIATLISNLEKSKIDSLATEDKLRSSESLVAKLESDNKDLKIYIESLINDAVNKTEALAQSHESEVNELRKSVLTRERAVSTSKSIIQQLKTENIRLEKHLSEAIMKISEVERHTYDQISNLESNLSTKVAEVEVAESSIGSLKEEILKAQDEMASLMSNMEEIQVQLTSTTEMLSAAESKIEVLESENRNQAIHIENLNEVIDKNRVLSQSHEVKVEELQKTAQTRERAISSSKSIIQQLKAEIIKLENELGDAYAKNSQTEQSAFEQITEIKSNLVAKIAEVESAEFIIQSIKNELAKAHNEIALLVSKVENLQTVIGDKESIINISQAFSDSLTLQHSSLQEKVRKLEALEVEFDLLKIGHSTAMANLRDSNLQNEQKEKLIESLEAIVEALKKETTDVSNEKASLISKMELNHIILEEKVVLERKLDQIESQLIEKEYFITQLQQNIQATRQTVEDNQIAFTSELRKRDKLLEDQSKSSTAKFNVQREILATRKISLEKSNRELENLKRDYYKETLTLNSKIKDLENQITNLSQLHPALDSLRSELKERQLAHERAITEMEEKDAQLKKLHEKIEERDVQIQNLTLEIDEKLKLQDVIKDLETDLQIKGELLLQRKEDISRLEDSLNVLQNDLENSVKNHNDMIESLNNSLQHAHQTRKVLELEVESQICKNSEQAKELESERISNMRKIEVLEKEYADNIREIKDSTPMVPLQNIDAPSDDSLVSSSLEGRREKKLRKKYELKKAQYRNLDDAHKKLKKECVEMIAQIKQYEKSGDLSSLSRKSIRERSLSTTPEKKGRSSTVFSAFSLRASPNRKAEMNAYIKRTDEFSSVIESLKEESKIQQAVVVESGKQTKEIEGKLRTHVEDLKEQMIIVKETGERERQKSADNLSRKSGPSIDSRAQDINSKKIQLLEIENQSLKETSDIGIKKIERLTKELENVMNDRNKVSEDRDQVKLKYQSLKTKIKESGSIG